jgi:hypothetical protein
MSVAFGPIWIDACADSTTVALPDGRCLTPAAKIDAPKSSFGDLFVVDQSWMTLGQVRERIGALENESMSAVPAIGGQLVEMVRVSPKLSAQLPLIVAIGDRFQNDDLQRCHLNFWNDQLLGRFGLLPMEQEFRRGDAILFYWVAQTDVASAT